jgi:hypothetical protein
MLLVWQGLGLGLWTTFIDVALRSADCNLGQLASCAVAVLRPCS